MIYDMERIGDQASDIADITKYLENSELTQHVHIQQMAEAAMGMLTDSIEAFVKKDLLLARKVMKQDDVVDELFNQVKSELITAIAEESDQGEICIDMVSMPRNNKPNANIVCPILLIRSDLQTNVRINPIKINA